MVLSLKTMVKCYAKCLDECSNVQSKEHYLSKSIWQNPEITFEGFAWTDGSPKTLPVKNVAPKILCNTHNTELSPLDVEAQRLFDCLRKFHENQIKRAKMKRSAVWKTDRAEFNGFRLERLFAKIGVGVMQEDKKSFWHMENAERMSPPCEIVKVIFGRSEFRHPMGLYLVNSVGDRMPHEDRVTIMTLLHPESNGYIGSIIAMRGRQFFINLSQISLEDFGLTSITENVIGYGGAEPLYRPKELHWHVGGKVSGKFSFQWLVGENGLPK